MELFTLRFSLLASLFVICDTGNDCPVLQQTLRVESAKFPNRESIQIVLNHGLGAKFYVASTSLAICSKYGDPAYQFYRFHITSVRYRDQNMLNMAALLLQY